MSRCRWPVCLPGLFVGLVLMISASVAQAQSATQGEWSQVFNTKNVMIHVSVLPDSTVLFWGRREASDGHNLNPRVSTTRIWDPSQGTADAAFSKPKNQPGYNLFCSGHSFLPDGRLFVAGGHITDGHGEPHATIYNYASKEWLPQGTIPDMTGGRWYPTVVTLADGAVLVSLGNNDGHPNETQQVWKDGSGWRDLTNASFINGPYYPRMHVVSDGRLFMSGGLRFTQFLDTSGTGLWTRFADRVDVQMIKKYAPSVMYTTTPDDVGKVVFIGGGNAPTKVVEVLDLEKPSPAWVKVDDMQFARTQHNGTLLPDGTILVTGGTQGARAKYPGEELGFNDLRNGSPIWSAELWNPAKPAGHQWTKMAKAAVDRCYHSTAVLLPDATVLSAGGGEYSPPNDGSDNLPEDTHSDAQIFSPPYLFKADNTLADRPVITAAPTKVKYGDTFSVSTNDSNQIGKVTWIRLSSVTHSFNFNQRMNVLAFTVGMGGLTVTAPSDPKRCPPGHYMLFVLNKDGVPSVAKIVQILP
ncbi:galactose oxidase-like domain-containing protein [Planctomicrobium piriforme]|uniref:Uncharacterized protein n=1 Tax=Planctomicrobium piriforme TaxID=1576369 RepID=A0A1I3GIX1_9PLAN|nr:galactose oxidase-like domain-containing protein [Planctomicrobium piriforme]SFI23101.1 protein of unknown function [Planctomicrobium piriforme]